MEGATRSASSEYRGDSWNAYLAYAISCSGQPIDISVFLSFTDKCGTNSRTLWVEWKTNGIGMPSGRLLRSHHHVHIGDL